ncbi:MAG TPA: hypothetical protein VF458_15700 [Ktedonobacteraceae bacterium]
MGQYQQWLFAQEVDRRLKAELETLETELFYLQDRITILEQVVPATENVILQALAQHLQASPVQEQEAVQPAPAVTNGLPRLDTPRVAGSSDEEAAPYLPRTYARREMSEDMLAFFDRRSQTDPRLSALLQRERQRASSGNSSVVDEETRRLNENIQRWFARWHRNAADDVQAEEVEDEQ